MVMIPFVLLYKLYRIGPTSI